MVHNIPNWITYELEHNVKTSGPIIFPFHGSKEVGKGLENKILKQAGLK